MNQKVCSVGCYKSILLSRSWSFRVFAIIFLLLITFGQYALQGNVGEGKYATALPWLIDIIKKTGWVLPDEYALSKGENKATLLGGKEQCLIADAVKWVVNGFNPFTDFHVN